MRKKKPTPSKNPFQDAKTGRLEALFAMMYGSTENVGEAYKWLNVAYDFGHREAAEYLATVLEASDLRYDDDVHSTSVIHFELGLAYLKNTIKHPRPLARAKRHLQLALEKHDVSYFAKVKGEALDINEVISKLEPKAAKVLRQSLEWAADPFRKVADHLKKLKRYRQIGSVPTIIIENELEALQSELGKITAQLLS